MLLTAPYLSPAAAYTLLSERATAWIWYAPLAPFMKWIRASLFQTCPGVNSLTPPKMANHIMVGRQIMQQQLVPGIAAGPATSALTYMVHQAQYVSPTAPSKKKTPAERWDLQASELYRLANIPGPEDLPDI